MKRTLLVAAAAALGTLGACGDPMHPRQFPRWAIDAADPNAVQWSGCLGTRAFVRKSGKEGIGVTVEARSRTDCVAEVHAVFALADGTTAEARATWTLAGRSLTYQWVPLHFDGDRAWNHGVRAGVLTLEVTVGGQPQPASTFRVVEHFEGGVWGSDS